MIRLSDLRDKVIATLDGETLGRAHEVRCDGGRVIALSCGPASLIERWTDHGEARQVPWECVCRLERDRILVTPDPPQLKSKTRASRSREGTRRPNGRRSKR